MQCTWWVIRSSVSSMGLSSPVQPTTPPKDLMTTSSCSLGTSLPRKNTIPLRQMLLGIRLQRILESGSWRAEDSRLCSRGANLPICPHRVKEEHRKKDTRPGRTTGSPEQGGADLCIVLYCSTHQGSGLLKF